MDLARADSEADVGQRGTMTEAEFERGSLDEWRGHGSIIW